MRGEMSEKSYQAVRCLYCSRSIPLSTRMIELAHIDSGSTSAELQRRCQVFILRCDACSKESRYLKTEIDRFEMLPPQSGDVSPSGPRRYPRSLPQAAGQ
jgi:hypothetical protein